MTETEAALITHLYTLERLQEWDAFVLCALDERDRLVRSLIAGTKDQFDLTVGEIRGIDRLLGLPQRKLTEYKESSHA